MEKIELQCEVITPMFLGGADGKSAELRSPSLKGAMRFWWRAINSSSRIDKLQKKETEIFGGGGEHASKSNFLIKISENQTSKSKNAFPQHNIQCTSKGKTFPINILEYLAYGTLEYNKTEHRNNLLREYINAGSEFVIDLFIKKDKKDILLSLYFLSAFGGLGSRSRNGFGGFNVLNKDVFKDLGNDFVNNCVPTKEMLGNYMNLIDRPPYSAFSSKIKLFKTKESYSKWDNAIAEIGIIYRKCRGLIEEKHQFNKRQYIGAPLDPPNEHFKSILERHSKPYFLRVIKENGQFTGYILYIPSKYCEGLENDRENRQINHEQANKKFENVCNEFNDKLSKDMAVML